MWNWLKTLKGALIAGAIMVALYFATMARKRAEDSAKKWQQTAVDEEVSDVANAAERASEALAEAKNQEQIAKAIKVKERQQLDAIGNLDGPVDDTISRWRATNRLRNRTQ